MSVLSSDEQELLDVATGSVPNWLSPDNDPEELLAAAAKVMQQGRVQLNLWIASAYILQAAGIYLDQHAKDRGMRRRLNETDAALRTRIRFVDDAVTYPALFQKIVDILTADGIAPNAAMVEVRIDCSRTCTNPVTAGMETFINRGYRISPGVGYISNEIIVILPFGTSAATAASVADAVRLFKAGGVRFQVEVRGVP